MHHTTVHVCTHACTSHSVYIRTCTHTHTHTHTEELSHIYVLSQVFVGENAENISSTNPRFFVVALCDVVLEWNKRCSFKTSVL